MAEKTDIVTSRKLKTGDAIAVSQSKKRADTNKARKLKLKKSPEHAAKSVRKRANPKLPQKIDRKTGGLPEKGQGAQHDDLLRLLGESIETYLSNIAKDDSERDVVLIRSQSADRLFDEEFSWLEAAATILSSANKEISQRIKSFESRLEALEVATDE